MHFAGSNLSKAPKCIYKISNNFRVKKRKFKGKWAGFTNRCLCQSSSESCAQPAQAYPMPAGHRSGSNRWEKPSQQKRACRWHTLFCWLKRDKRCLNREKTNKRCLLFYSMPSLDKLELNLLFSTFLSVPFCNVSQYICIKILKNKWFNH